MRRAAGKRSIVVPTRARKRITILIVVILAGLWLSTTTRPVELQAGASGPAGDVTLPSRPPAMTPDR